MGVFLAKSLVVLFLVARVSRSMPALRDDQWIRIVTRRILPLAWANLLLVFASRLLIDGAGGGAP
jgi:NADH:ubiquinone oxidoreductase subunit H